jgi:hypothetical protein
VKAYGNKVIALKMFGCLESELDAAYQRANMRPMTYAVSILSDAQELLNGSASDREMARQYINRAKYIVMEYCVEKK